MTRYNEHRQRKVIGLGLSRTGTMALHKCIEGIGMRSHHYSPSLFMNQDEIFSRSEPSPISRGALVRSRFSRLKEYHSIKAARDLVFSDIALIDLPNCLYFKELKEIHPNGIFIYTYRSMNNWLESMEWLYKEGSVLWRFNDLDYAILYNVYGTAVFDSVKIREARLKYERELDSLTRGSELDYHSINIDTTEISEELVCRLLRIPFQPSKSSVHRHNERRSVSLSSRLDYKAARILPGYPRFKKLLGR